MGKPRAIDYNQCASCRERAGSDARPGLNDITANLQSRLKIGRQTPASVAKSRSTSKLSTPASVERTAAVVRDPSQSESRFNVALLILLVLTPNSFGIFENSRYVVLGSRSGTS